MRKVLDRLSYANVTATLALFVALGGTSYAVATLPRNSVGPAQLRANSVGGAEIRPRAVRSSDIRDHAVRLRDIAKHTRQSLAGQAGPTGPPGPPGPTYFASVDSAGNPKKGDVGTSGVALGVRAIQFHRSVSKCAPAASIASLPGDPNPAPPGASIRTEVDSAGRVIVRTWDSSNAPKFYPFNLIVAC